MIEEWRNLNCFSGSKIPPGIHIARRIYLCRGEPALTSFAASFRRSNLRLQFLATTLSHLLDGFEMVVASGSLGYFQLARVNPMKGEVYTDAKKISQTELDKS